jgi:hypothetical protein
MPLLNGRSSRADRSCRSIAIGFVGQAGPPTARSPSVVCPQTTRERSRAGRPVAAAGGRARP